MTAPQPSDDPSVAHYEASLEAVYAAQRDVADASAIADAAALATGLSAYRLSLEVDGSTENRSKHSLRMRRARARQDGTDVPRRGRGGAPTPRLPAEQ